VRRKIHWVIWYVAGTVVTTILFFPILWDGVVPQFIAYMRASLNPVGVPTYYFGRYYTSPNIPWHYIPVLIAITSMLSVVLLCVAGLVWFGYSRVHHPWIGDRRQTLAGVMGLTVIGSLSAALLLHARTYDGWRHMYYIYPSMIGLAVYAVHELNLLAKRRGGRVRILWCIVVAGIIIDCVSSVGFMVRNHPHEYVYFNPLAGGYTRAKQNFDLDYWGISYKQLLEHLLTLPTPARVYIAEQFPYVQFVMIPVLQSRGFTIMDTSTTADLIVEINRYTKSVPGFGWTKIFAASVGGIDISSIYARNGYSGQIPGRDTHL